MGCSYRFVVSDAIWDFQIVSQRWTPFEFWGSLAAFRPLRVCLTFSSIFRPFGDIYIVSCVRRLRVKLTFSSILDLFLHFTPIWVFDPVSLRVRRFGFLTLFHQMRSFECF